jgi:hypothetical protein
MQISYIFNGIIICLKESLFFALSGSTTGVIRIGARGFSNWILT